MRPTAPPSPAAGEPDRHGPPGGEPSVELPPGPPSVGFQTGEYPRFEAEPATIPIQDADFLRDFVRQNAGRLLQRSTALCRLLGIDDFSHDAVRQTVLRLLARGAPIADRGPQSAERYALVVLRRLCVDERRRRALEENAASLALAGAIEPDDSVDRLRADLLLDLGPTADPRRLLRAALCCFEYLPAHLDPKQPGAAGSLRAYWLACVEGQSEDETAPMSTAPESSGGSAARGKQLLAGWIHALCGAGARVGNDGGRYQSAWQIGFEAAQSFLLEHPDWWTLGTKRLVSVRASADSRLLGAPVAEQTEALLQLVTHHEQDGDREANRLVLEVDSQWTAELSGHTEAVRVRLGSRARSVLLRDELGALRAFMMIDDLDVAGETGAALRLFDRDRVGLVLSRRPGGLELEVLTGTRATARVRGRVGANIERGGGSGGAATGDETAEEAALLPPSSRGEPRGLAASGRGLEVTSTAPAPLHSPPMLEDELGGQVSAVRTADEETVRDGRAIVPAASKRAGRTLRRGTSRLARIVLAGLLVVTATFGVLFYQQVRFERQQAVDQAERKRLELERARLELEKAETERRIGELQRDLSLAKGEAERMRLQAEIEREKENVDVAPVGTAAASTSPAARPAGCRPGEPTCSDP